MKQRTPNNNDIAMYESANIPFVKRGHIYCIQHVAASVVQFIRVKTEHTNSHKHDVKNF